LHTRLSRPRSRTARRSGYRNRVNFTSWRTPACVVRWVASMSPILDSPRPLRTLPPAGQASFRQESNRHGFARPSFCGVTLWLKHFFGRMIRGRWGSIIRRVCVRTGTSHRRL
jgi:hypothetical protein